MNRPTYTITLEHPSEDDFNDATVADLNTYVRDVDDNLAYSVVTNFNLPDGLVSAEQLQRAIQTAILNNDFDITVRTFGVLRVSEEVLTDMVDGYIDAAAWVGVASDDGEPADVACDDFSAMLVLAITDEVRDFTNGLPGDDIEAYLSTHSATQFGHDFFLTRNGHGAGFWDRGLGALGLRLTDASKPYGETNYWLDDNGRVQEG